MNPKDYWTLNEAGKVLDRTRFTLMRWIRDGKLPARRVGNRWLIPIKEAESKGDLKIVRRVVEHSTDVGMDWLNVPQTPDEVEEIVANVAKLLSTGVSPVNAAGLKPLISGEVSPTPVFWRYLNAAIRRVLADTAGSSDSRATPGNKVGSDQGLRTETVEINRTAEPTVIGPAVSEKNAATIPELNLDRD